MQAFKKMLNHNRLGAAIVTVPMAPLPENRVKDAKAFDVSGVDLAGFPLFLWILTFNIFYYNAHFMENSKKNRYTKSNIVLTIT